jgi:hypothetical protein
VQKDYGVSVLSSVSLKPQLKAPAGLHLKAGAALELTDAVH